MRVESKHFVYIAFVGVLATLTLASPRAEAFNWPWQNNNGGSVLGNVLGNNASAPVMQQSPQVLNVSYIPAEMRLLVKVDRPQEISIYNPMREPHTYRFFINNAHIIGNATTIPVQGNDPYVKSIRLEQKTLSNLPAVLVSMDLLPTTEGMRFDIQRTTSDGSIGVAMRHHATPDSIAMLNYAAPSNPIYRTSPSYYPAPVTMPSQPYPQAYAPWSAAPQRMVPPVAAYQHPPVQMPPQAVMTPAANYAGQAVVWPMIKDIVINSNKDLNIVSDDKPLTVERVFTLNAPDRYVLDITPARLDNALRNRVLEGDTGGKFGVKTSQLDDDTVRVVLMFSNQPVPVQLTQENQNKLIHLSY